MKGKIIISLFSVLCVFSCHQDQFVQDHEQLYPDVDKALWSYFSAFEKEAGLRNIQIDLAELEITGEIHPIDEDGVAGTCQYGQHIAHVTVDRAFWNSMNHLKRELIVFHELGHCVLDRGHTESAFTNGICKSIMNSGLGTCLSGYNQTNRSYYIDELFQDFK